MIWTLKLKLTINHLWRYVQRGYSVFRKNHEVQNTCGHPMFVFSCFFNNTKHITITVKQTYTVIVSSHRPSPINISVLFFDYFDPLLPNSTLVNVTFQQTKSHFQRPPSSTKNHRLNSHHALPLDASSQKLRAGVGPGPRQRGRNCGPTELCTAATWSYPGVGWSWRSSVQVVWWGEVWGEDGGWMWDAQ